MSVFQSAIMGSIDVLTGASAEAAYNAAYGTYSKAYGAMHAAANAKVAAEQNIYAAKQSQINSDKAVQMKQDQAEAMAEVSAAASGTEGLSVTQGINQTKTNAAFAEDMNRRKFEQEEETALAQVYGAQTTLLASDDPYVQEIDPWLNALNASVGSLSMGDFMLAGALGSGGGSTGASKQFDTQLSASNMNPFAQTA